MKMVWSFAWLGARCELYGYDDTEITIEALK